MANPVNFQGNTVDDAGNVIAQAQITVTGVVSGLLPQLYSDVDLQNNITNPFNSNNDGSFEFYLENEQCNVKAEKDGFTREWKNLFLKKEGAWALEDGSNDSDFVTGYYTTPRGWNSRWSHKLTLESSWTGDQNYNDLTVTHTNVIINADSASTLNFEGDSVFGNATPPTNNPAVGDTLFNGQAGFNSTIAIADLSDQTTYKTMENINGDLQWDSQKFTGTAASKDLTSPSSTIWDDGNLVKTTSNIDTTSSRVMLTGNGGLLATQNTSTPDLEAVNYGGFGSITSATLNKPASLTNGVFIQSTWANTIAKGMLIIDVSADRAYIKRNDGASWQPEFELWTKSNTTVDINGFVKEL